MKPNDMVSKKVPVINKKKKSQISAYSVIVELHCNYSMKKLKQLLKTVIYIKKYLVVYHFYQVIKRHCRWPL